LRSDHANRENAVHSARAPLKNSAAVRRSRLKIITDVAGVLGVIQSPGQKGPFVLISENGD
jgi:hypothetical protein